MTMDDIESFLPMPHSGNPSEILLWNALRVIGHQSFNPPNLVQLGDACRMARQPSEMERIGVEFRARLQGILGILARYARGEGEGHRQGRDLIQSLEEFL